MSIQLDLWKYWIKTIFNYINVFKVKVGLEEPHPKEQANFFLGGGGFIKD